MKTPKRKDGEIPSPLPPGQVDRIKLAKAIALVLPGIARRELFVQANKLGIEAGHLVSYNDEISIRCACPELAGIEGAIDGRVLYNLLQKSTAETLTIEPGETQLTVRAGRMTARFAVQPLDLPLSEIEAGDERFVLPDRFGDALRLISWVCATDMSHPALACVRLRDGYIEGGDGYRLARVASIRLPEALLPARAAKQIADYDPTALIIGPQKQWVHFENADQVRISSRLYDDAFPDVASLYHFDGALEFSFPETLAGVLHRAAAFTRGLAHEDEEIVITLRPHQIVIAATGETGRFEEVVRWDRADVNAKFAIHPEFLQLALCQGTHCHLLLGSMSEGRRRLLLPKSDRTPPSCGGAGASQPSGVPCAAQGAGGRKGGRR